jgi:hypothetical protein
VCGGLGMAEEIPSQKLKAINFTNFKKPWGPQSVIFGLKSGLDQHESEIGSVFQS